MIRVAVFASGSGSNAENIVRYFAKSRFVQIQIILTNNSKAGVIERAERLKIPCEIFSGTAFKNSIEILEKLEKEKIDFIVLAGFLILIPQKIIEKFKGKIINIHPALLPNYGGKGFYGNNVHQAVLESGALLSGITIHHVNEKFDDGEIIFQASCHISKSETPETLAEKNTCFRICLFPSRY